MESTDLSTQNKLESFFAKLEQLTKVQRILISVGIFVLIIAAALWFFHWPKIVNIGKLEEKKEKTEKRGKKAAAAKKG